MEYRAGARLMGAIALLATMVQFVLAVPARSDQPRSEPHTAPKTKATTDWSIAMVESTMKRYPTAKDLGSWGYAKSLYLYGQYLVWKRTREPRYFQYISGIQPAKAVSGSCGATASSCRCRFWLDMETFLAISNTQTMKPPNS